jgi:hypothetical protein
MDKFRISWQAFEKLSDFGNPVGEFINEKSQDQSLTEFYLQNKDNVVLPKYFINDLELSLWLKLYVYRTSYQFENVEPIYVFYQSKHKHLPSLKMYLLSLLGIKINLPLLKEFGFNLNETRIDWNDVINQANKDAMLFCCPCGDRGCGYFPLEIKRQDDHISWKFDKNMKAFTFGYEAYKNEFWPFFELINFQNDL